MNLRPLLAPAFFAITLVQIADGGLIRIDPIVQQAYVKASNTGAGDMFGFSVSASGDTAVVGAVGEESNATGVNGDQSNNSGSSGAAYVFVRSGATWSQQAYLKASNTGFQDEFGFSVSLSGDTLVVGAPLEDSSAAGVNGDQSDNSAEDSGAAYVFVRSGTTWNQQAYLKASNSGPGDRFGESVAISGDTIVVGAFREESSATGVDGDQADNSAVFSGAAYVFVRSGTTWSQQAYLKASNTEAHDQFGGAVSVSGDTIVVGAHAEDSDATGANGDQNNHGADGSGAAYVFVRSGGTWSQQAYLKASNTGPSDLFGDSVSVSGDTVVIGAYNEKSSATGVNGDQGDNSAPSSGAAYVFVRSGATWSQQAYLKASNTETSDYFGSCVEVSDDTVVVGAWGEDSNAVGVDGDQGNNDASRAGAAYVFTRNGATWSQQAYLKASNSGAFDVFGMSASVTGTTFIVGGKGEASNATGIDGNQGDNSAVAAGAAYVFALDSSGPVSFCDMSDGALALCPCANSGGPDSGCDNAQSTGGVSLSVLAQATATNGATLQGAGFSTMGSPTAIVLRSSTLEPGVVFGDGVECLGFGSLVRLAATTAVSGVSTHAFNHGAMAGPGAFYYQLWYRNTPSSYCTPSAFNLSSGRTLVW